MSKKKLIIIIISSVLVLAAGGFCVWWFFFKDPKPAEVNGYYEVVAVMQDGNYTTITTPSKYIKVEDNKITVWTLVTQNIEYSYIGENVRPDIFKTGVDNYYRLYVDINFSNSTDNLNYLQLKKIDKSTYEAKTA